MCGIAGYFGTRELATESVKTCLSLMRRRGPDHAAFQHFVNQAGRNVYLLHSRLSIIDLDPRSNQPFNHGSHWLIFNGELYNYCEVRKELEDRGATFTTTSDTEVLLQAFVNDGPDAFDNFEGMWAFAVYNSKDGSLVLSRDRFGEKPLYFYRDASGVYFGSEVKFIQILLGRRLEVNTEHIYRYIVNGYKALFKKRHFFFKGLAEVPRASYLVLDAEGAETLNSYWQPSLIQEEGMSRTEAVSGVRERLFRAMQLRLRADVPLAFCMSGGIDSNTLISIAKRVWAYDVHGFTVMNSDARYEEKEMVDISVRELGIKHTGVPVETKDFLKRLRHLIVSHDSPLCTISYYAHWLLMREIAESGYKISISGTAADELFTGYYDHHLAYLYEISGDKALHASSLASWKEKVLPFVRNRYLKDPDLFKQAHSFRGHIYLDAEEFSASLLAPWSEDFDEEYYVEDLLRNRMLNELFHEVVPPILREDDLNAMYYSIENRSPFLDRALMEFAFSIPTPLLIQGALTKSILREAMSGVVPQPILDNPRKVGFNAPILSFLDTKDPKVRQQILEDSPIYEHVRRSKVEALLGRLDMPNSESKFLFNFLNSKIFLEEFA